MRTIVTKHRFASILKFSAILCFASVSSMSLAGEPHQWFSGTYLDPAVQRPDFLPHTITRSIPEHRQVYNRPRYITGWVANAVEPSSQEAMAWRTNDCNGNYQNHSGAFVPMYCYPKPWESLNTRGRPSMSYTTHAPGIPAPLPEVESQEEIIRILPSESSPVEPIPTKKIKVGPEQIKKASARRVGVEVPPPSSGLK